MKILPRGLGEHHGQDANPDMTVDAMPNLPTPEDLRQRVAALLPIPRSLTGEGVRETLALVGTWCDVGVNEVATGTPVYDWTVPEEWVLRRATLQAPDGRIIADSDADPLAVVGYSAPMTATMDLEDLEPHLHSLPEHPDWTPYRTSYYNRTWGFCLPDRVRRDLQPGQYVVDVDTELSPGHLTYGEVRIPGQGSDGQGSGGPGGDGPGIGLISAHLCHPGMANDNASGMVVAAALAAHLSATPRRMEWRVIFAPGTIGPLVWMTEHADIVDQVRAGFVLAGVGDCGGMTLKQSRHGGTLPERALQQVLADRSASCQTVPYSPWGYDERQYTSLGFDLPVSLVMRTPHGTYPEYHTSADDLDFISAQSLADSLAVMVDTVEVVERNRTCLNLKPHGEPQLGKRGLYPKTGGRSAGEQTLAMLWVLALSDGKTDLLQIADRSTLSFDAIAAAAAALEDTDLLRTTAMTTP